MYPGEKKYPILWVNRKENNFENSINWQFTGEEGVGDGCFWHN